jgi:hypothetical protein
MDLIFFQFIGELFDIFIVFFAYFLDFVLTCMQLRFCISFFLSINPYFEPFLSLWSFTNPIIWGGRKYYPRVFGVDLTPMINLGAIRQIQKYTDRYIKYRNPDTIKIISEIQINKSDINELDSMSFLANISQSTLDFFHNLSTMEYFNTISL